MVKLEPFAFCTNNVPGNELEPALEMARRCGFSWVELAAIDGISEQIDPDRVSPAYAEEVMQMLKEKNLRCLAVSGHCDMTEEASFVRLLKKIEFAGRIGARYLNTRCGPKDRMEQFLVNVKRAAEEAAKWNVILNLESYGDIVGEASTSGPLFAQLNLPNVRYNYDPGNTYRFAKGAITIEEDVAGATVPLEYLHLKDTSIRDGWIWNDPIGSGALNYPAIFEEMDKKREIPLPCGLEIPMSFRVNVEDLSFGFLYPTMDEIEAAVRSSLEYVSRFAEFSLQAP